MRPPTKWPAAQFQYISIALNLACNKDKLYKTLDFDPGICSILIFQKRVWDQFLHHNLRMIFQEKYFSCYILLTYQISFSNCLYFSRYWAICVLQLFVNQTVTSSNLKLILSFLFCLSFKPFRYMTKGSRQKLEYLENEKSF